MDNELRTKVSSILAHVYAFYLLAISAILIFGGGMVWLGYKLALTAADNAIQANGLRETIDISSMYAFESSLHTATGIVLLGSVVLMIGAILYAENRKSKTIVVCVAAATIFAGSMFFSQTINLASKTMVDIMSAEAGPTLLGITLGYGYATILVASIIIPAILLWILDRKGATAKAPITTMTKAFP